MLWYLRRNILMQRNRFGCANLFYILLPQNNICHLFFCFWCFTSLKVRFYCHSERMWGISARQCGFKVIPLGCLKRRRVRGSTALFFFNSSVDWRVRLRRSERWPLLFFTELAFRELWYSIGRTPTDVHCIKLIKVNCKEKIYWCYSIFYSSLL